jgi:hypothetical protein
MQPRGRSPWTYVAIGCAALLAAGVVAFVTFLFVGQRMAREVREQVSDPTVRRTAVRELLDAARFPDGYEPTLGLSVPLLGRVVVLEGHPARSGPTGEFEPRGLFLYLVRRAANGSAGRDDDLERLLGLRGLATEAETPVVNGSWTEGEQLLAFRTVRARMKARSGNTWPALVALVDVHCPDEDGRVRFAAWIESAPASGNPAEEVDLTGTPADPQAIKGFMSHFHLCPHPQ